MGVVQFDIQKIEQLLNSATSERQRKMYQALLNKARSQERASTDSSAPGTTASRTEKKTQTKTKTTKAKKKATRQSAATTEASPAIPKSTTALTESKAQHKEEESKLTLQNELKSQSSKSEKQQSDVEASIFQAIGAVVTTPYVKDDRLKVTIDDGEYDLLHVPGFRRYGHTLLREEVEKNGSAPMFLRLYPGVKFEPNSQQPRAYVSLVNFSFNCEQINDMPKGFILRGIWQYIPDYKSGVISIYRNRERKEFFKKLSKARKLSFAKPHHIPVVWDAPVEPFKFNPQGETGEKMPRYFVEVRAILKDGLYVVEEMLKEPTLDIPKFIKVPKKRKKPKKK